MSKPLCISYIRFSSTTQREGASLERQLEMSRKYAELHGLHLDESLSYRDLGKSAYSGDHVATGELGCLLNHIKQGKIPQGAVLLVESLDRLSRESILNAFNQFQEILNEGIKIVTLSDGVEYTKDSVANDFSKLLISLSIMARANEESERKSKRIRDAFDRKRKNLSSTKMTKNGPCWLELSQDRKEFKILKDKADIVKRIFQMSYDGVGIKTISRIFNIEGVQAFRSKIGWNQSSIRKILSSRSVVGEFQPHTFNKITKKYDVAGEPILDYYPKIIEDKIFNAVQMRLDNGTHRAGRTAKVENLFGGITKCGYCGARMDVVTKGKFPKEVRYLVCDNARRGVGKCTYLGFICNELESSFIEYCKENDVIEILQNEKKQETTERVNLKMDLESCLHESNNIDVQIRLNEEELEQCVDKLMRSQINDRIQRFVHRKIDITIKKETIEKKISDIEATKMEANEVVDNILKLYESTNNSFEESERVLFRSKLRTELRQIIKKVVVYPKGRIFDDSQISKNIHKLDSDLSGMSTLEIDSIKSDEIEAMKLTQHNTKNNRFYTIFFKNGNFREIQYNADSKKYSVTFERTGNRIDWTMKGQQMKPIINDDKIKLDLEIAEHQKLDPERQLTEKDIEGLKKILGNDEFFVYDEP